MQVVVIDSSAKGLDKQLCSRWCSAGTAPRLIDSAISRFQDGCGRLDLLSLDFRVSPMLKAGKFNRKTCFPCQRTTCVKPS